MEVISEGGNPIRMKPGQTQDLGRSNGFKSSDNTISRRHISFSIPRESDNEEIRLQFEVLGRNPIYVSKDNEVKIFRRFERGEMGDGDMFCVSAKSPVWYTVRKFRNCSEDVRQNALESELEENLESDSGFEYLHDEGVDISHIDPVKEFGFVVEGHEFDSYPKKMIKSFKDWEWFLEKEEGKDSGDEDEEGKKGKTRRKRKKGEENDDEWSAESEDEKVLVDKSMKGKMQGPKYKTRSKNHGEGTSKRKKESPTGAKNREEVEDEDEEDEDEEDETLGGFIVDDENSEDVKEEEDEEEVEEEEELGDEDEEEDEE